MHVKLLNISERPPRPTFYRLVGKRSLDLILVLASAPFILSVLALVALVVRFGIGSPVLFRQKRTGKGGQQFLLYKFRTMIDMRDAQGKQADDELRITKLGRFLRATSLDELPGLWNVLCGEMSLVGPRPLLPEYLDRYSAEQFRRHEVPAGLTGLAQVNGRNALSWDEKFLFDIQYVREQSLWLDMKILLRTVFPVLKRDGITAANHATMPPFTGSEQFTPRELRDAA